MDIQPKPLRRARTPLPLPREVALLLQGGGALGSFQSGVYERLDELGVDVHILYPTIFLMPITHRQETELALCRSYNRWLAEIWRQGRGRLRWIAIPPLMDLSKAVIRIVLILSEL